MENIEPKKQMIYCLFFSMRITSQEELTGAICGHAAKEASTLLRQQALCSFMTVFAKNNAFNKQERYTPIPSQYQFETLTVDTRKMVGAVRLRLAKIYKDSIRYAKPGVMLLGICQHDEIQLDLFE